MRHNVQLTCVASPERSEWGFGAIPERAISEWLRRNRAKSHVWCSWLLHSIFPKFLFFLFLSIFLIFLQSIYFWLNSNFCKILNFSFLFLIFLYLLFNISLSSYRNYCSSNYYYFPVQILLLSSSNFILFLIFPKYIFS